MLERFTLSPARRNVLQGSRIAGMAVTSVNGENISTIGGGNPGNSPPQVEGKFPMRETVEVSLFPAELPKKVILSAKNEENPERF